MKPSSYLFVTLFRYNWHSNLKSVTYGKQIKFNTRQLYDTLFWTNWTYKCSILYSEDTWFESRPKYRLSRVHRDLPQPLYANIATALLVTQQYSQKGHFLTIICLSINQSLLQHCWQTFIDPLYVKRWKYVISVHTTQKTTRIFVKNISLLLIITEIMVVSSKNQTVRTKCWVI